MDKRMNKKVMINLVLVAAFAMLCMPASAADDGYALLVQQSPPGGGSVNLGTGVHKMGIGQTVALSATPKSGYRFLYWLGDVSAADATETSIQIDSPKMVVAVFARDEFEDDELGGPSGIENGAGGGGRSGQRGVNPGYGGGSAVSPASANEFNQGDIIYNFPDMDDPIENDDSDTQVPGDQNDIVVPSGDEVPEPATLVLLGIGSSVLLRRKRN